MKRYLGLDLGTKTLGIAISDRTNVIASVYKTLRHEENYDYLILEIDDIIKEEQITNVVLGYPKNMNNTASQMSLLVEDFALKLREKTSVEVSLEDERLSSVIANKTLITGNVRRQKRKKCVDNVAAVIILQAYLDKINYNK